MGNSTGDLCPESGREDSGDLGMEEWTEVAHRGGRRGNYLPDLQGVPASAPWRR